jgi:hypothetical protein
MLRPLCRNSRTRSGCNAALGLPRTLPCALARFTPAWTRSDYLIRSCLAIAARIARTASLNAPLNAGTPHGRKTIQRRRTIAAGDAVGFPGRPRERIDPGITAESLSAIPSAHWHTCNWAERSFCREIWPRQRLLTRISSTSGKKPILTSRSSSKPKAEYAGLR